MAQLASVKSLCRALFQSSEELSSSLQLGGAPNDCGSNDVQRNSISTNRNPNQPPIVLHPNCNFRLQKGTYPFESVFHLTNNDCRFLQSGILCGNLLLLLLPPA